MAPSKAARNGHDDSKSEAPHAGKEKNGQAGNHHQTNGKPRRVASAAGANKETATTSHTNSKATANEGHSEISNSSNLQWSTFDREILHAYRRAYRLNTPTAFASEYHQLVLSIPGGVGKHSPTMARRREFRRQSKDQLSNAVRKHFNGLGVQENDIIVDFIHKVRTQRAVSRQHGVGGRSRRTEYVIPDDGR